MATTPYILVGGFYATAELFTTLQNWEYKLEYNPVSHELKLLKCNPNEDDKDGKGWTLLMRLANVPEETTHKLVEILDLELTSRTYHTTSSWQSRIPLVVVNNNGSKQATQVLRELETLDLPYHVESRSDFLTVRFGRELGIEGGRPYYKNAVGIDKGGSAKEIIEAIRVFAEKHKKPQEEMAEG